MVRPRSLRRLALATLLWVGIAALVPAHFAVMICRFAGVVHFQTGGPCCAGAPGDEAPARAAIDDQRCCSLRTVHLEGPPVERLATVDAPLPPPARPILLASPPPLPQAACAELRRGSPLALGPPAILAKQSFLL